MKKILILFLLLVLLSCNAFADQEVNMNYSGILDVNGKPLEVTEGKENSEDSETLQDDSNITIIYTGVRYDGNNNLFCYDALGIENAVCSNAYDGLLMQEEVNIFVSDNISIYVYKNGEPCTESPELLTQKGSYSVNYMDNGMERNLFSFKIIDKYANDIDSFNMPYGFMADKIYLDDLIVAEEARDFYFEEEGHYRIEYRNYLTNVYYNLDLTIDRTAPTLLLKEVGKDSIAHGPVDISDLPKDAYIKIVRNGEKISYNEKLTEPGNYEIYVADDAGNITSYAFTIQVYLNTSGIISVVIIVIIILSVIFYVLHAKKKMRVR